MMTISRKAWLATLLVLAAAAAILTIMGRVPICTCGTIKLWHGVVNSAENSQHISDWYSFSHIIHGFLFFATLKWLLPRVHLGWRLVIATMVEASWELLENTQMVIDRYREATMAYGYAGDAIINSMSDCSMMILGFLFASKVRARIWIPVAIGFELFTLWRIRDNLTLNVLMLVAPIETIRDWQSGG